MKYTVYNKDGEILNYGSASVLPEVDNVNTFILLGENPPDISLYCVVGGEITLKENSQEIIYQKEWVKVKAKRKKLLDISDYTQLPDVGVDKIAWAEYRQKLRDLPSTVKDPFAVVFPTPPE